ncbi:MAG: DNA-processing protein DprA [Pirellulales bacterium]|nr:DNA-processing protein DprA [Pirellulales bacterium]
MTPPDLTAPPAEDDLIDLVRFCLIDGVGPRTRKKLLERFGSPRAVFEAAPSELREVERVGPKLVDKIRRAPEEIPAEAEITLCREQGVEILTECHPAYPRSLREIPDPPGLLFVRGTLLPADALAIGIVGTRHASPYGLRQADRLAQSLTRAGLTIVSGLARGIDAAAHRGTLSAGGRTIAVLGSGVLNVYPPEHQKLADEIASRGAVISEMPPRSQPLAGVFPQRNRLISGLSLGVIVVEAADRSGALITARHAMEQGREVFAVPGSVENRTSRGCHRLIRDGVTLVESADDVLEQLGPLVEAVPVENGQTVRHPAELLLNETEQQILSAIPAEAMPLDDVITATGLPVPQVLSTVSVLEMRRLIRRLSGNRVMRL